MKLKNSSGSLTDVSPDALEELRSDVRGEVVTAGHECYAALRSVWNGLIDKKPGLLVRCTGTADVMAAVRFARRHRLPVCVRGGGGSFGVVTSFEFKLHPVGPRVWMSVPIYPLDRAAEVLPAFRDIMELARDELPLHCHHNQDEYSYVIAGTLGAILGDDVLTAEAGSWAIKPRKQWHTVWNAGDTPCEIIEIMSPDGFENYFREVAAAWGDVERFGQIDARYYHEMDLDSIPNLCGRFGLTFPAL